jgi:hypothetical protein
MRYSIALFALLAVLAACSVAPTAPPPGPTAPPATLAPASGTPADASATPPATPASSATVAPSATAAVTPAAALSADGPWLVIPANDGLYVANADGSAVTRISAASLAPAWSPQVAVAPRGGLVAYLTAADPATGQGLELHVTELPGGRQLARIALTNDQTGPSPVPGEPSEPLRAMLEHPSLAWSPFAPVLAFIGAQDGPSADLYVYDAARNEVRRLTDGAGQAFQPVWSGDGLFIVHVAADGFGTGAGASLSGVWAARDDGSSVQLLYAPGQSGMETIVGWTAPGTFVVDSWDPACGRHNLRRVDAATGSVNILWSGYFQDAAIDPESGATLMSIGAAQASCNAGGQAGLFLIARGDYELQPVRADDTAWVRWLPEARLFTAGLGDGTLVFLYDGTFVNQLAYRQVSFAPDQTGWAAYGDSGLSLQAPAAGAPLVLSSDPAAAPAWTPDSQALFFRAGPSGQEALYRAQAPDWPAQRIAVLPAAGDAPLMWARR